MEGPLAICPHNKFFGISKDQHRDPGPPLNCIRSSSMPPSPTTSSDTGVPTMPTLDSERVGMGLPKILRPAAEDEPPPQLGYYLQHASQRHGPPEGRRSLPQSMVRDDARPLQVCGMADSRSRSSPPSPTSNNPDLRRQIREFRRMACMCGNDQDLFRNPYCSVARNSHYGRRKR